MSVQIIDQYNLIGQERREEFWIHHFETMFPKGLNQDKLLRYNDIMESLSGFLICRNTCNLQSNVYKTTTLKGCCLIKRLHKATTSQMWLF